MILKILSSGMSRFDSSSRSQTNSVTLHFRISKLFYQSGYCGSRKKHLSLRLQVKKGQIGKKISGNSTVSVMSSFPISTASLFTPLSLHATKSLACVLLRRGEWRWGEVNEDLTLKSFWQVLIRQTTNMHPCSQRLEICEDLKMHSSTWLKSTEFWDQV